MKFLLIIILAGGGFFYYNNSKKTEAYNDYIGKDDNSRSGSSSSGGDFKEFTSTSQSNYKGLSKSKTIETAMRDVSALHDHLNSQFKGLSHLDGSKIKVIIDDFLKNYVKTLGKAYSASTGDNKAALKTLKTYIVNWYQRVRFTELQYTKYGNMIKYSSKGNLGTMQSTNRHALTELAKIIKDDNHYVNTFRNNYFSSIKKYGISNTHIKNYSSQIAKDLNKIYKSRIAVNNSLKKLVDKVYAFNSYVLRNSNNGYISVNNRGKYEALVRIINEIKSADADYKRTRNAYYNNF